MQASWASQKNSPLIEFFPKQNLFNRYELLSKFDRYKLTDNDMKKLREILEELVKDSHIYVSQINASKEREAKTMQKQYMAFKRSLEKRNDKITLKTIKKLDDYWKSVDIFFGKNDDKMPCSAYHSEIHYDEDNLYANIVNDETIEWFNNNSTLFYKNQRIEVIKESLEKANENPEFSYFVNKTILVIQGSTQNNDLSQWIKKIYVYSENKTKKCVIVFTNGNYYVDQYGNVYLNEMYLLQAFAIFTGINTVLSSRGEINNIVAPTHEIFLQDMLKCFERIKTSNAFVLFRKDCFYCGGKAVNILKKVKCFYNFFWILDELEYEYLISLSFSLIDIELRILFPNLQLLQINTTILSKKDEFINLSEKVKKFYTKFDVECIKNVITYLNFKPAIEEYVQYEHEIKCIQQQYQLEGKEEKAIMDSLESVLCFKNSTDNYKTLCFLIATKIVLYIKSQTKNASITAELSIRHLKYITLWTTLKFRDDESIEKKLMDDEKNLIKNFYQLLIAVIESQKSQQHCFENYFSAAYHFKAHYDSLEFILRQNGKNPVVKQNFPSPKNFPALNETNLGQCLSFYLKELPDYIFKNEPKVVNGYSDEGEECTNYYYKDSVLPIVGIKYKTATNKTFIKTIRQKFL